MTQKTFEQGREEIIRRCEYFEKNTSAFCAPGVKEAQVRQNLIDHLFSALGWDIYNNNPVAPQYREVVLEDSLDVAGSQRAPDYTFRIGPKILFTGEFLLQHFAVHPQGEEKCPV